MDVFISHATEDKTSVARPLAELLRSRGLDVWLDESEIQLGDRLDATIETAIATCRRVVVVLSPTFLAREWTIRELQLALEREARGEDVLIPVWHGIDQHALVEWPALGNRLAARTDQGIPAIAMRIYALLDVDFTPGEDDGSRDHFATLMRIQDALDERPPDVYLVEPRAQACALHPFLRIEGTFVPFEGVGGSVLGGSYDDARAYLIETMDFPADRIFAVLPLADGTRRIEPLDAGFMDRFERYGQPVTVLPDDARLTIHEPGLVSIACPSDPSVERTQAPIPVLGPEEDRILATASTLKAWYFVEDRQIAWLDRPTPLTWRWFVGRGVTWVPLSQLRELDEE